jgi:hypothetical protein
MAERLGQDLSPREGFRQASSPIPGYEKKRNVAGCQRSRYFVYGRCPRKLASGTWNRLVCLEVIDIADFVFLWGRRLAPCEAIRVATDFNLLDAVWRSFRSNTGVAAGTSGWRDYRRFANVWRRRAHTAIDIRRRTQHAIGSRKFIADRLFRTTNRGIFQPLGTIRPHWFATYGRLRRRRCDSFWRRGWCRWSLCGCDA